MYSFGAGCTKLVELFGRNPLALPPEDHALDPRPKSHGLPCRLERGGHRATREEPGLWRHLPESDHPLDACVNDKNDGEEHGRPELVPEAVLDAFVQ